MRHCPKCNRIYPSSDDNRFCLNDGTNLLTQEEAAKAPTFQDNVADFPTLEIKGEAELNSATLEKAARISRAREIKELHDTLYNTEDGVRYALEAVENLLSQVEKQAKRINEIHPRVNIKFSLVEKNAANVFSGGCEVSISWAQMSEDTLEDGELWVRGSRGSSSYDEQDETFEAGFKFDVNSDFQMGWVEMGEKRFVTSEKLAGECLDRLINLLSKESS